MSNIFTQYILHHRRNLSGDLMPWFLVGAIILITAAASLQFYFRVTRRMIDLQGQHRTYFHIRTGSGFSAVRDSLAARGCLASLRDFEWLARRKNYVARVKPGRYLLKDGMRNNELVNLLRTGKQEPVRVTFNNIRSREELAGRLGRRLETDSGQLARLFNDPVRLSRFGTSPTTLFTLFIPNTYEFYWNTSGDQLLQRMDTEFKRFWSPSRRHKADSLRMTIPEVITLASIVEKESNRNEERPVIAGVYINRLRKGIPLQADPTVIFAWNDYSIRRVTGRHTRLDSPYNTYLRRGLPPGPICLPSIASVDAVLNVSRHGFYYFCAREDFSGYHRFASTLDEHNRNARRYQKALDAMKIK